MATSNRGNLRLKSLSLRSLDEPSNLSVSMDLGFDTTTGADPKRLKLRLYDQASANTDILFMKNDDGLPLLEVPRLSVTSIVSNLPVTGDASVGGTLDVTGDTSIGGTLAAGTSTLASATITNNASVGGTLAVTSNATVGGTLGVTGDTSMTGTLAAGASTLASATITNNASVGGTLAVTGNTTVAGDFVAGGNADNNNPHPNAKILTLTTDPSSFLRTAVVDGTLSVTGNTSIGGTLGAGASTLASAAITNNATVGGTLDVTGTTTLGVLSTGASTLASATITGAATVGGNLTVTGDLQIEGNQTVVDTQSITITDPIIQINNSGSSDVISGVKFLKSGETNAAQAGLFRTPAGSGVDPFFAIYEDFKEPSEDPTFTPVTANLRANNLVLNGALTCGAGANVIGASSIEHDVVGQTAFAVTGRVNVTRGLIVNESVAAGGASITGNAVVNQHLSVGGNFQAGYDKLILAAGTPGGDDALLTYNGHMEIEGRLSVVGDLSADNVNFTGDVTMQQDLTVTGALTAGSLTFSSADISGNLEIDGNLDSSELQFNTIAAPENGGPELHVATGSFESTYVKSGTLELAVGDATHQIIFDHKPTLVTFSAPAAGKTSVSFVTSQYTVVTSGTYAGKYALDLAYDGGDAAGSALNFESMTVRMERPYNCKEDFVIFTKVLNGGDPTVFQHNTKPASAGGLATIVDLFTTTTAAMVPRLSVAGDILVSQELVVGDQLVVDGKTELKGSVRVEAGGTDNFTVNIPLSVAGATQCSSTLKVGGAATLLSTLDVTSNINIGGQAVVEQTLDVTGATTLAGLTANASTLDSATINTTLDVTGASTLASADINGNTTVGGTFGVTGATTLGAATVDGTLGVTGNTSIGGTLGAGVSTLASASITNDATVGGTLDVTGTTTLGVLNTGASAIASAAITNDATVGGTLGVTGATTLGVLSAGASTLGATTITGTVSVNGATTIGGNTTVGGTFNVSTAHATNVGGLTAGASTLASATITNDATVDGTLTVIGTTTLGVLGANASTLGASTLASATVNGAATVGGTLGVTGATTLGGTTTLDGDLNVSATHTTAVGILTAGASTLASAGINGDASVDGTLGVTGTTSLGVLGAGASTLTSATITNNATVGGTLGVTGATTLGVLSTGASTLTSASITNNATVGGTLGVTGAATLDSAAISTTLDVTGTSSFADNAEMTHLSASTVIVQNISIGTSNLGSIGAGQADFQKLTVANGLSVNSGSLFTQPVTLGTADAAANLVVANGDVTLTSGTFTCPSATIDTLVNANSTVSNELSVAKLYVGTIVTSGDSDTVTANFGDDIEFQGDIVINGELKINGAIVSHTDAILGQAGLHSIATTHAVTTPRLFLTVGSIPDTAGTENESGIRPLHLPDNSEAGGVPGTVVIDKQYLYVCVSDTDTKKWRRIAMSNF